jgi:hypothetical protein
MLASPELRFRAQARLNGIYADGEVSSLAFSGYTLVLQGSFNYVYGPTSSGGSYGYRAGSTAYFHDYYQSYANRWWGAN